MKKITAALLLFCSVFFFIILVITAGRQTYRTVYDHKSELIIERKAGQSAEAYIDELAAISNDTGIGLFHSLIRDVSLGHASFDIYSTSPEEDFPGLVLRTNKSGAASYYTTDFSDEGAKGWIISLPVFEDISLYPFSELRAYNLNMSRFFVRSDLEEDAQAAFSKAGYVVYLPDQTGERLDGTVQELWRMFLLMVLVFLLSVSYIAFEKRREIVIKKINGYDERSIFVTTFLHLILAIPVLAAFVYAVLCIILGLIYPMAVFHFVAGTWYRFLLYAAVCTVLASLCCFLVQIMKRTSEIRGFHANRILYLTSAASRILIVFAAAYGLTNVHYTLKEMLNLERTYSNSAAVLDDYVTLSLNEGSTMISQDETYFEHSFALLKSIMDSYTTVIVDSGDFFNDMDAEEDVRLLYVNSEYFGIEEVYDENGKRILPEDFEGMENEIIFLIPDNTDAELEETIEQEGIIFHYKSPQNFHTFSEITATDTGGLLKDPLITLTDDDYLMWSSQYLIGEQFVLIKATSEDMYQELKPLFTEHKMETIILEAPKLNDVFMASIHSERVRAVEYGIFGIFCLLSMLFAAFFEASVYYANHKRILTIRRLHGYGWHAYTIPLVLKLITTVLLLTAAFFAGILLPYMGLAIILDLFAFLLFMSRMEEKNMAIYLKGDF